MAETRTDSTMSNTIPVLIVDAGPTGLTIA
jgi:hypothetical protein